MDGLCAYLSNILREAAQQIGYPKDKTKTVEKVFCCPSSFEASQTYRRCVRLPQRPEQNEAPQMIVLASCLEAGAPAQFLFSIIIDILAGWLTDAVLEEDYQSLRGESFCFFTQAGRSMDAEMAAAVLVNQMRQHLTREVEQLLDVPFSLIDSLSEERYEGTPLEGNIVIVFGDCKKWLRSAILWGVDGLSHGIRVLLNEKFRRHIVKLMTGCSHNAALFTKDRNNSGPPQFIGCVDRRQLETWEQESKDVVRFHIKGPMDWAFYLQGKCLFRRTFQGVCADLRELEDKMDQERLAEALSREFQLDADRIDRITGVVNAIRYQSHGTSVLVMSKNSEVWKHMGELASQKKATEAWFSSGSLMNTGSDNVLAAAARMDGAIIMDTEGNIGFIAALVDGPSRIEGDLSRGSRFNSIANFVAVWADEGNELLGIVFSSDGGMAVLPGKK